MITGITNVKNTINKINFKSGVQHNQGAKVINNTLGACDDGRIGNELLISFTQSPLLMGILNSRQASIEAGMNSEQKRLNALA